MQLGFLLAERRRKAILGDGRQHAERFRSLGLLSVQYHSNPFSVVTHFSFLSSPREVIEILL